MKTTSQIYNKFELNTKFYFSKLLNKPFVGPHWVYLSVTNRCPFDCRMCGVKKLRKGEELSTGQFKKIIHDISTYNGDQTIMFTGGEPFVRKDLFELINYSVSLGLPTEVVTNGYLIDDKIAEKIISSGLRNIAISIDGANAKTHNSIRSTPEAFERAVNAIKLLRSEKDKRGDGPQISVWTTMMKQNIPELYDILLLARKLGADVIVYHPVILNQTDMQNTSREGPLWPDEKSMEIFEREMAKIIDYQKRNGFVAFLHDPNLFTKYFQGENLHEYWKCNPFEFVNIGPDGNMQTCGDTFGNARNGVKKVWESKEAEISRKLMKKCTKSCLQTCWARPEAEHLNKIINSFLENLEKSNMSNSEKCALINKALKEIAVFENLIKETGLK